MVTVKFGSMVQQVQGTLSGSIFRSQGSITVMYSKTWTKRGRTWRSSQERAQFSAISSTFRSLTHAERATWSKLYNGL